MKGKSPAIHMAHSIGSFFGLSGLANDVQGKQIVFVGDRVQGRQPLPFILPPQNAWTWARVRYVADGARCAEHYRDEDNKGKLWTTGAGENDLTEKQLPRLLALPTVVAEFVAKQGRSCLPHTMMAFINSHVDAGTAQVPAEKWDLLLDWGLAASQTAPEGASLLNLGAPEPALCQGEEFLEWCSQKLATAFGREPEVPRKLGRAPTTTSTLSNVSPRIWAAASWQGFRHWHPLLWAPQDRAVPWIGTPERSGADGRKNVL